MYRFFQLVGSVIRCPFS